MRIEAELERYHRSMTKDRLRYQNLCLQRMRQVESYIGMDALLRQLENAKLELSNKYTEQESCDRKIIEFIELDKQYQQFIAGNSINELNDNLEAEKKSETLFDEIYKIKEEMLEFEKNPILRAIFSKIDNCKKILDKVIDEISDVKSKKNSANDIINNADMIINALQINIDDAKGEYERVASTHVRYIEAVKEKYSEVRKSKQPDRIVVDFRNQIQQGISNLNKYINLELLPLQRNFSSTYACDYLEGLDGADQYQLTYNSLINIDLEYHRDSLNKARIRCKERFRKDILFRMKDDVLHAKQQFKALNKVMEKLSYGEESYRFSIEGNKDKELNIFYNIIIDKDNQQIEKDNQISIFSDTTQSDIFESQVEEFMQRIMVDVENHAQENITGKKNGSKEISMYVDYRTYLDYDIIVKNSVTNLEVPLSKVSGDGSGGENQAPFYVAICASLLQIYQQNENCISLVLLDEAFNKGNELIMNFCKDQLVLLEEYKKLPYEIEYDNERLEKVVRTLHAIMDLKQETYIRNFSTALYRDSKEFQKNMRNTIQNILYDYSDIVVEKERILEMYYLFDNPTYVMIKGNAVLEVGITKIILAEINGGIAIPNAALKDINHCKICTDKVVTVENLTTFHDTDEEEGVIIYLGGFHNETKQRLLELIYSQNGEVRYFHKGDLDVYGFAILENLKGKTGIPFEPLEMDLETLKKFFQCGLYKKLTAADKKAMKLNNLLKYKDVFDFMILHDCKVEQESLEAIKLICKEENFT